MYNIILCSLAWHCDLCFTLTGVVRISGGINFQLETQPTTDPPVFTLNCTSTGGPATTVSWTRDGDIVTANNSYINSSQVTDTETATYVHTLRVTGRQVGLYRCSVSNSRTSPAAATTLQLQVGDVRSHMTCLVLLHSTSLVMHS